MGSMTYDKTAILEDVIKLLEDSSAGWESEFDKPIGPETLLGADLELKSITLVQLVASIQQRYDRQDLPFQDLIMPDDQIIEDLSVAELVDFLYKNLNT
jgi:acyl carrier protein